MTAFSSYAHYYNLFYRDKDYNAESDYIVSLINKFKRSAVTILDLGCGTGRHAEILSQKGYNIHGVDCSETMLAEAYRLEGSRNLSFSKGDIRTVRLAKKFDVVVSLFHVMSYQTTTDDLLKAFQTIAYHLDHNGLLIFDCWYGPAVLTIRPEIRVKRIEDENWDITRIAEPILHPHENIVDVNYRVMVTRKDNDTVTEIREKHRMRYLFKPEVELLLQRSGFKLKAFHEFLTRKTPSEESWNVVFVALKNA
jgi:SAM-dependent methyltransferase